MEIFAATYTLTPLSSLNSRVASGSRSGALLKVVDEEGAAGYADLHPWTSLGDLALDEQLNLLARNRTTALSARSLKLAALDREARRKKVSAFAGLSIPKSHYLVTDLDSTSQDAIREAMASGFEAIKVKVGRDPVSEISVLKKWSGHFFEGLRLRLDFNGTMTENGFVDFVEALPSEVARAIEFVEDPVPWNALVWGKIASLVPLALDRASEGELEVLEAGGPKPFQWLIAKPAVQDPERIARIALESGKKVAVTSYMDHPVGQMGAALEAARLTSNGVPGTKSQVSMGHGGLSSHLAFEKNEFSERIVLQGGKLVAPSGTGIGFDDLLAAQSWKRIL